MARIWELNVNVEQNNEEWENEEWNGQEDIFNDEIDINALAPLPALGEIDWEIEREYQDISEEFWGLIDNYFTVDIDFDSGEDWDAECEYGWTWELFRILTYRGKKK